MSAARDTHTATLMSSGLVFITAGEGSITVLSTSEKYDPATGAFVPTALHLDIQADGAIILLQRCQFREVVGRQKSPDPTEYRYEPEKLRSPR